MVFKFAAQPRLPGGWDSEPPTSIHRITWYVLFKMWTEIPLLLKVSFFCSDCQELKYYQVSKITSRGRTENGTQGEQSAKLVWKETRVQMPAESFSSNFLGLRKTKFEEMLLLSKKPLQLARRPHLQNGIRKSQGKGDCLLRAFMTACCHSPGRQR